MMMMTVSMFRRWAHQSTLEAMRRSVAQDGKTLTDFMRPKDPRTATTCSSSSSSADAEAQQVKTVFVESYGCQMNVNDSEIVLGILRDHGFTHADSEHHADIVLLNTCAIRENAEDKVWRRLESLKKLRKSKGVRVGVLGCMAERLKQRLLDDHDLVDVVCGPDAYRSLPSLLSLVPDPRQHPSHQRTRMPGSSSSSDLEHEQDENQRHGGMINVLLSADETYADVNPVRIADSGSCNAFVSIMRGCNNLCSYCIVPFTRGRERSRPVASIVQEIERLAGEGQVREVTLLGQNVNSYADLTTAPRRTDAVADLLAPGFRSLLKVQPGGVRFAELLERCAEVDPEMRIRFTSPHPKDFPDEVLEVIARYPNICKSIHVPAQSGSDAVLARMRRGYSRAAYLDLIQRMRTIIPGVALSSDFIAGFCGETESDHQDTLSLLETVQFDHGFLFAYSMREKTHAHRRMDDDVPEEVKQRRLRELVDTFYRNALFRNQSRIGSLQLVLVEGSSKRQSETHMQGRADNHVRVHFDASKPLPLWTDESSSFVSLSGSASIMDRPKVGEYVIVRVTEVTSASMKGVPLARTRLQWFCRNANNLAAEQHQQHTTTPELHQLN